MPSTFNNMMPSEYWKFFTDFKQWDKNDSMVFDKEDSPGYFRSCSIALLWMLNTTNRPVNIDYIITLRNLAYHSDPKKSRGLALDVSSGISLTSFTKEGLRQLIERQIEVQENPDFPEFILKTEEFHGYLSLLESTDDQAEGLLKKIVDDVNAHIRVQLERKTKDDKSEERDDNKRYALEKVAEIANRYLAHYKKEIQESQSDDDKLKAIVRLIQNLHQFHLFSDGNGRTFCFFLLNRLLLDQDLSPTIVQDPGYFTGWSVEELVNEVKEGQKRFDSICNPLELPMKEAVNKGIAKSKAQPIEENQLFVSPLQQAKNEKDFHAAILRGDRQKQINILENMPSCDRMFFVSKQYELGDYKKEQKMIVQDVLERFKWLQWCGYDNDASLFKAILECDSIVDVKKILSILNKSLYSTDSNWKQLAAKLMRENSKEAANILLKAFYRVEQLQDQEWFDLEKYVAILMASSDYKDFDEIKPQYLRTQYSEKIAWSIRSLRFIKEYLYQAPKLANVLFSMISNFQTQSFDTLRNLSVATDANLTNYDNNIYLYIDNDCVFYKTKCGDTAISINIEDDLSKKIKPEELKIFKGKLQELRDTRPQPLGDLSRSALNTHKKEAWRRKNNEWHRKEFSLLNEGTPNLATILRELAENTNSALQDPEFSMKEKMLHVWCEKAVACPDHADSLRLAYSVYGDFLYQHPEYQKACLDNPEKAYERAEKFFKNAEAKKLDVEAGSKTRSAEAIEVSTKKASDIFAQPGSGVSESKPSTHEVKDNSGSENSGPKM